MKKEKNVLLSTTTTSQEETSVEEVTVYTPQPKPKPQLMKKLVKGAVREYLHCEQFLVNLSNYFRNKGATQPRFLVLHQMLLSLHL